MTQAVEPGSAGAPIGVLLANLGTPAAPRAADVRRYLRQFLTDRRVVELPALPWRLVLELAILPRRAPRSAEAYALVWTAGSALLVNSRRQADALGRALGPRFRVRVAMRYGEPSIAVAVDQLLAEGCERLVLLPAFPQYASATTGSAVEETFRVLARLRAIPALAVVPPYALEPGYLDALAAGARRATAGRTVDHWVLSFHGIPVRYARSGDPYPLQCQATARALSARLGLAPGSWTLAWQSRFGREPWLEPATDRVVLELAPRAQTVAVLVPGFTADCLETLEELGIRLAGDFRAARGGEIVLVPALNDDAGFVATLRLLVERAAGAPLP